VQSTVTQPTVEGLGAFSLVVLLLGASACSTDTVSATTTSASGGTSTTLSDTSDSSEDASTSTDTSDTANDTPVTSGSFYAGPEVDYGQISQCDPFAQDCPEGEKCVGYASVGGSWDANKCVPILGDGQAGDPCTYGGTVESTDDCDAESFCWKVMDVEGEPVGVCTEFCQGDPDEPECPIGTQCFLAYDGSINLCLPSCDPVLQDCEPGLACYWSGSGFACSLTTVDVALGDPCGFINDCAAGLGCMPAELLPDCFGSACCASYCSLMVGAACAQPGTECSAFFEEGMAPLGYEDVGVCILPGS
jgi:hypothetical protein